jgi:hypothetical protein
MATIVSGRETTSPSPCDVDKDGSITVADVQQVIKEALGEAPPMDDLSGDKAVNAVDAEIVITGALGLGCSTGSTGRLLPAGYNVAMSNLISVQNGAIGSQSLPAGYNVAMSNLISVQNGTIGSQSLPTGYNVAMSDLISVQNGTIGSQSLPTGQNQAVSKLISAQNGVASNVNVSLKVPSGFVPASGTGTGAMETPLTVAPLNAGETVTVRADLPAPIYLNGVRAGNDPLSPADLTFVVPEGVDFVRIHAGDSGDSDVMVQRRPSSVVTGQVVDANGVGVPNAMVHLRHAGVEAEFFQLKAITPAGEAPLLAGLKPDFAEPASSLAIHDPAQALGYFPIGNIGAPNFAVRLRGEFQAQADGSYLFFVAATDGAQLSIDGKPRADVHSVRPGFEAAVPVELSQGWHEIELLVYSSVGSAELVLSFAPPGGVKRIVAPHLLRAESPELAGLTDANGNFSIAVPAWLDRVEAMATVQSASGSRSGVSGMAGRGVSSLGQIQIGPNVKF